MTAEEMQARIEFLEAAVADLQEANAALLEQRDELRAAIDAMLSGLLQIDAGEIEWRQ